MPIHRNLSFYWLLGPVATHLSTADPYITTARCVCDHFPLCDTAVAFSVEHLVILIVWACPSLKSAKTLIGHREKFTFLPAIRSTPFHYLCTLIWGIPFDRTNQWALWTLSTQERWQRCYWKSKRIGSPKFYLGDGTWRQMGEAGRHVDFDPSGGTCNLGFLSRRWRYRTWRTAGLSCTISHCNVQQWKHSSTLS